MQDLRQEVAKLGEITGEMKCEMSELDGEEQECPNQAAVDALDRGAI